MFEEIQTRLFNVFTLKAIAQAIATQFAIQIPWDSLFSQFQEIHAAIASGNLITAATAVLGFGLAIANLLQRHPAAQNSGA
jgi:hypothetical protein